MLRDLLSDTIFQQDSTPPQYSLDMSSLFYHQLPNALIERLDSIS